MTHEAPYDATYPAPASAPAPAPAPAPARRSPWRWLVAGVGIAVGLVLVAGAIVFVATPRGVSDGARAAVETYLDHIAAGRGDEAAALVPITSSVDTTFASTAGLTGRTSGFDDVSLAPLGPFDRPATARPVQRGDEVVRVTATVDGTAFTQDLRVAPGGTPESPWQVKDPFVVTVSLQPTALGDIAIGDAVWFADTGDLTAAAPAHASLSPPAAPSLAATEFAVYPGVYSLEGRYGEYFDSAPQVVRAVPTAGSDASDPVPLTVLVPAKPTAALQPAAQAWLAAAVESCFGARTPSEVSFTPLPQDACDVVTANASDGLVLEAGNWTVTPPLVELTSPIAFRAYNGNASGTLTNVVTGAAKPVNAAVHFDGYLGVHEGELVFWVDTGR